MIRTTHGQQVSLINPVASTDMKCPAPFYCFSAMKPLFLIGTEGGVLPEQEGDLQREIQYHQDILLSSRKEEYHKTAYKILGAYIWVQWYNIEFKYLWYMLIPFFMYFQLLSSCQIHSQN